MDESTWHMKAFFVRILPTTKKNLSTGKRKTILRMKFILISIWLHLNAHSNVFIILNRIIVHSGFLKAEPIFYNTKAWKPENEN